MLILITKIKEIKKRCNGTSYKTTVLFVALKNFVSNIHLILDCFLQKEYSKKSFNTTDVKDNEQTNHLLCATESHLASTCSAGLLQRALSNCHPVCDVDR